ncbi:MAG: hypothetical protein ISR58_00225 [Anaerolineales bacterium]|nr:hypothetical protein [Chloroflexota bacterium]MBL6979588.1 hypothetical protein [Anaerolineales bacterium]
MKNIFTSLNGAITLSVISLMVFLGRTFLDFYFVYEEMALSVSMVGLTILANLALFGGWIWALLSAVQGSRRGLGAAFGFNLFFLLIIAVGTLVSYCPSPCRTGWPVGEILIWASLVAGLLAAGTMGIQLFGSAARKSVSASKAKA